MKKPIKEEKPIKEVKASKELTKFCEKIMDLAPADERKRYKVPVGPVSIPIGGDAVNDIYDIMMGCMVIPGELPEDRIARKYKALKAMLKCRTQDYINNMKICVPAEELFDMNKIVTAINRNKINEDTFRLARKYFEVPTIAEL